MSLSQSAVANKLRLLKLSYEEQTAILETELSERHARALLRISDKEIRMESIRRIAAEHWNVQQTEAYVEALLDGDKTMQRVIRTGQKMPRDASWEADNLVKSLKRDLERMKKEGKTVTVDVQQNLRSVDVSIRIAK